MTDSKSTEQDLELSPHDRLQCFFDDALPEDEAASFAAEIEASEELQGQLRALERLGEFVQLGVEDLRGQAETDLGAGALGDSLFARIEAGLASEAQAAVDAEPDANMEAQDGQTRQTDEEADEAGRSDVHAAPKRPNLRVIEGEGLGTLPPNQQKVIFDPKSDRAKAEAEKLAREKQERDSQERIHAQGSKTGVWPAVFVAVALAAAGLLAFFAQDGIPEDSIAGQDPDVVEPSGLDPDDPDAVPDGLVIEDTHPPIEIAHVGSMVEEVDFGANTGTVFEVPGEEGVPIPVVWISEETSL